MLRFATFAQFATPFNAIFGAGSIAGQTLPDARLEALTQFARRRSGFDDAPVTPASTDASFRRYFRVGQRTSFVVMDAPPGREDSGRFITIAGYLLEMGLNAPRVIDADLEKGFLLLTDLGEIQYLSHLETHPQDAERLYGDAIRTLVTMQLNGRRFKGQLPPYDEALLRFELSLFRDWLCERHLALELDAADERHWQACCDVLVANALEQPTVFVHRDYHSRNLMLVDENNPGILDFQDAVEGPWSYDIVSLLRDCYIEWPAERVEAWARDYFDALPESMRGDVPFDRFLQQFDLTGAQRHLKAAGIFARLKHRDGRDGYLADIPRTLSYVVNVATRYESLEWVGDFLQTRVLPALGTDKP